jgi:hypothetical protein
MQEVLLALDPDFLDRLAAALGHAAMLATNAHLQTPICEFVAAAASSCERKRAVILLSMGAAGSPLTSLDPLIRAFLLLRHRRRH